MSNFFRKISKPLVVLALVLAVFSGHAFAVEGDTPASAPGVADSPAVDSTPSTPSSDSSSDGFAPADTSDSSPDDLPPDDSGGWSNLPGGFGGYDTFTTSGADVTVNIQRHDTLSVTSVAPDIPEVPSRFVYSQSEPETPTLAETIRSLFGTYTPRTQTVTTYYDGQPISTEEQIVPGLAGLDYEWLTGVGMFALVTFCLFRLLGGILKNG